MRRNNMLDTESLCTFHCHDKLGMHVRDWASLSTHCGTQVVPYPCAFRNVHVFNSIKMYCLGTPILSAVSSFKLKSGCPGTCSERQGMYR